jgi:4-hydroxybenzoate polyprenyltransferase
MIYNFLRLIRFHHWLKNLLIFIPLIAAHKEVDAYTLNIMIIAFLSFNFASSGVYIFNDIVDLENDKRHSSKKKRPLASGNFNKRFVLSVFPLFYFISISLAMLINYDFLYILSLYIILNKFYSLFFKRFIIIDCLMLASFYTLRIIAGSEAFVIELSFWLLTFSVFIFLSLAFIKRYVELNERKNNSKSTSYGRGYKTEDKPLIINFGIISGYLSALIMALYIQNDKVFELYKQPEIIWLYVPCIIFWISYIWTKAKRNEVSDDPIIFALNDKISLYTGVIFITIFLAATFGVNI